MIDIADLRAISESQESLDYYKETGELAHIVTMDTIMKECYDPSLLDEAFLGTKPVQEIQAAMDKIYAVLEKNPNAPIYSMPENRALEDAVKKVFGFKYVSIMWTNTNMGTNAYTLIGTKLFTYNESFESGTHDEGFYDKNHVLRVYITLDNGLVHTSKLTSKELVGMLLHEIGHNFDYSPATMIALWMNILQLMLATLNIMPINPAMAFGTLATNVAALLSNEFLRGPRQKLNAISTYINNALPSFGKLNMKARKFGFKLNKILNILFAPTKILSIPIMFLLSPITYFLTNQVRAGERYADTFAGAYGYGPEMISGLEKINKSVGYTKVMKPFDVLSDLVLLEREIICFTDPHQTNQTRVIKMMDALKTDLRSNDLDPELRKAIEGELKQLETMYQSILNMDDMKRMKLTKKFRAMLDSWYNGKAYLIVDYDGNQVYAD